MTTPTTPAARAQALLAEGEIERGAAVLVRALLDGVLDGDAGDANLWYALSKVAAVGLAATAAEDEQRQFLPALRALEDGGLLHLTPAILDRLCPAFVTEDAVQNLVREGYDAANFYPEGAALRPEFLHHPPLDLFDRQTPIASIGSCFAREVKDYLTAEGYSYVQTAEGQNARHGSAAWDRVYSTFSLRQEFARALAPEGFVPATRLWTLDDGTVMDPHRNSVQWATEEEANVALIEHQRTAREALLQARLLIVTLGLTEVWRDRLDGSVFARTPHRNVYDPARHEFHVSTVEENVANVEEIVRLMGRANPECRIVFTVSPVPLLATFQGNVVLANARSKATLLAAARRVVEECAEVGPPEAQTVHYFPSYELVTQVIRAPFLPDNRHIARPAVRRIMEAFVACFGPGPGRDDLTG